MVKMIGCIGCFVVSHASINGKKFIYDGTIKDMVKQAVLFGSEIGDTITTDDSEYILVYAKNDFRCNEVWASRVWN